MAKSRSDIECTKRLMGALGRLPPKQHSEMKLGKARTKRPKSTVKTRTGRAASAKQKNA